MNSTSSSSPARSSHPAARNQPSRKTSAVGAVVGAVVGGVLGVVVAKKVKAKGVKGLVPAQLPAMGKRAVNAVKHLASDAMDVAKVTAAKAADQAALQMKTAAQQFVVDSAQGKSIAALRASGPTLSTGSEPPAKARTKPAVSRKRQTQAKAPRKPRAAR